MQQDMLPRKIRHPGVSMSQIVKAGKPKQALSSMERAGARHLRNNSTIEKNRQLHKKLNHFGSAFDNYNNFRDDGGIGQSPLRNSEINRSLMVKSNSRLRLGDIAKEAGEQKEQSSLIEGG